jgi:hypothetical protein
MVMELQKDKDINVVEIGSGTGVFADTFLDHIKF